MEKELIYSKEFKEDSFWSKLKNFARPAGKKLVGKTLVLFYCMRDEDTPKWAKTVIAGALGYFIMPIDLLPDITPLVGYCDDMGMILSAMAAITVNIKPEHRDNAEKKLSSWFG